MTEMLALLARISAAEGVLDEDRVPELLSMALLQAVKHGWVRRENDRVILTPGGVRKLLELHAEVEAALDPAPRGPADEDCPSIPWLTTVQTHWIDAISLNYAVEPGALAEILPAPLEPEIWKGTAWVQVLMSSLRDMRPQGLAPLFGVCFYQVSYRAAVRYRGSDGSWRRGGCFVKSETNHPVMRAVGNALAEFRFHEFGAAEMVMLRDGDTLHLGVDSPGGKIVAQLDTRPLEGAPPGSVWGSLEELHQPLVECYDAFGVEPPFVYILTIDREPWNARFVAPRSIYCEWLESGPLARGARFDSALHLRECAYRWRPLRREKIL